MINRIKSRIIRFTRKAALKLNYLVNNYAEVIWIVGDGRSGTTWVSDLINHDKKYREMFEPLHPQLVPQVSFITPHQYIRANELNGKIESVLSDILSGKLRHKRVDTENRTRLYNGLLVKDIFANLLCYSASIRFQNVKPILLIRNPFAVAISKYKKKNWIWFSEPLDLLDQKNLYEDYLLPFEDLIRKTSAKNDYILNQILIWSVINYIPLRQFKPGDIYVCFYENIYQNPHDEISKIFEFVRGKNTKHNVGLNQDVIDRPSRVIGTESNLLSGTSPVTSWSKELSTELIEEGMEILQHFGFDNLYDENSMPNMDVLNDVHSSA